MQLRPPDARPRMYARKPSAAVWRVTSTQTSAPPFELLESKLLPPRGHDGGVLRGEVISTLEDARATPIVCLSAGPGWGKTTLLAQWASRSKRPFAWVAVDEHDNDPVVLLTYVAAALDRVSPLDPRVFDALASPGVSVEATVVPRLGAAMAESEPVVVVLDDLHLLENRASLDAVEALTRHVAEGSQMTLSARGHPAIPLAALRARGLALEIGENDLRMDEAEAGELLSAAGLDMPEARVAELTEQTEGWSAGLYLAALSLRARGHKADDATTFSGSDRLVSDYLRSELLAYVPADDLRFLMRTAVLRRMSGPLCDEVLEMSGSTETLESFASSNLFVVPLDADGQWYRYHHLFQELLERELAQADPDLQPTLLSRASEWCEKNGEPETSIHYAQQAGDVNRVAVLVERYAVALYESGRGATAERWFDWLEAEGALERNAAIGVLGAVLSAMWGQPARAERWAEAAESAGYEGELPDGSPSIDGWLAFIRAMLCQKGMAAMGVDAEFAVQALARWSPLRPNAMLLLGASRLLAGETDQADDLFAEAAEEGVEVGAAEGAAVAMGERAAVAIGRGEWVKAEEFVEQALRVARRSRLDEYPASAYLCALAARVALHLGETKRAQDFLARAQRLRPRVTYALPYFAIQTRLELARAYLTLADASGAETVLHEIEAVLRRQPDLGTLPSEVEELRSSLESMHTNAPGASTLTVAELRLLPYLATHLTFQEIGERLYVSRHTVKSHVMAVYRKLSVNSRNGAVERAGELGLL